MTVGLAASVANGMLDDLSAAWAYSKLHTADPGASGASAASAETTRKATTWGTSSAGAKAMSGSLSWTSWSAGSETLSHLSGWTASTAGTFGGSVAFSASKAVANGDTLTVTSLSAAITPIAA